MIENKFTLQLDESFKSKDYSLFTRRCLDFTNDYNLPDEFVNQIFELRKNYLSVIEINPTQQDLVADEAALVLEKLKSQNSIKF